MKDVIFKVTSKRVVKMQKEKGFLDMKTYFLDLSTNDKIPVWKMNQLVHVSGEICVYTQDEKLAEVYRDGLETYEKNGGD